MALMSSGLAMIVELLAAHESFRSGRRDLDSTVDNRCVLFMRLKGQERCMEYSGRASVTVVSTRKTGLQVQEQVGVEW